MKILTKLEKSKTFWYLLIILLAFFLLRLPSLIEPYWYGDEGIYQVLGIAINEGRLLYTEIWDNKPPLLYLFYALFNSDQFSLRLTSLVSGIFAIIVFFFLSQKLLQASKSSLIATGLFTILFATPYLEGNIANAENFILLLALSAGLLIYSASHKLHQAKHFSSLISLPALLRKALQAGHFSFPLAGFLLGIAFLFKTVALFDFLAFTLFLILCQLDSIKHIKKIFIHNYVSIVSFALGFILPVVITFLFFLIQGNVIDFIQSAFFGNIDYVEYQNTLWGIPQGLLLLKLLLLIIATVCIARKRKSLSQPHLFLALWFSFALFSSLFSGRPYTHYLLVLLPSFCLVAGLLFTAITSRIKIGIGLLLLTLCVFILTTFNIYGVNMTLQYYENVISFLNGKKTVHDYQAFFDPETPRDYELISYINNHTTQSDKIFIWGDSPQIYTLTNKLPPGRYTTAYHIMEHTDAIAETQEAIDKIKPRFIITLSEAPPLPFHLPSYIGTYGIKGAAIYERSF